MELSIGILEGSRRGFAPLTADAQVRVHRRDENVDVEINRSGQCCRLSIFIACMVLSFLSVVWLLSLVVSQ